MSHLVTIARYYDIPAAICAKSALDAYQIPCFLQNDGLARLDWHWIPMLQGIKLHTFEEHFAEALELLVSVQAASEVETPAEAFWRRKYFNGFMALVMISPINPVPFVPYWMRKRRWLTAETKGAGSLVQIAIKPVDFLENPRILAPSRCADRFGRFLRQMRYPRLHRSSCFHDAEGCGIKLRI